MTTTETTIYERFNVSFDQVQACHRIGSTTICPAYYQVESSKDDGTEYIVRFDRIHNALTCTCPAGNPPVLENGNLAYAPRACWHRRAAAAHAEEYRTNRRLLQEKEEAQAVIEIAAELAEDKLNNLQAAKAEAKATRADGANAYNRPAFQFLR